MDCFRCYERVWIIVFCAFRKCILEDTHHIKVIEVVRLQTSDGPVSQHCQF